MEEISNAFRQFCQPDAPVDEDRPFASNRLPSNRDSSTPLSTNSPPVENPFQTPIESDFLHWNFLHLRAPTLETYRSTQADLQGTISNFLGHSTPTRAPANPAAVGRPTAFHVQHAWPADSAGWFSADDKHDCTIDPHEQYRVDFQPSPQTTAAD